MLTEAVSHFVVFGGDTNSNPPMLFGGKTYSEMDRCAAIAVRRILYSSPTGAKDYVTKTVTLEYLKPGKVGDSLRVYAKVVEAGEKSLTVDVVVEREVGGLG
jgi:acyl-CoA hydrolase